MPGDAHHRSLVPTHTWHAEHPRGPGPLKSFTANWGFLRTCLFADLVFANLHRWVAFLAYFAELYTCLDVARGAGSPMDASSGGHRDVGWICRPARILLRSLTLASRIGEQGGSTYYSKKGTLTELTTKWENSMYRSATTGRRTSKGETTDQMLERGGTSIDWRN